MVNSIQKGKQRVRKTRSVGQTVAALIRIFRVGLIKNVRLDQT